MESDFSIPLNESEEVLPEPAGYTVLWIFSLLVHGVTFVFGVLGNGLVIWVAGFRMTRTVSTICYLNLALADFSFSAILPFRMVSVAMREKWPFGLFLCKLVHVMIDINLFVSVYLITVIALDRCICVLHPAWAQNHRTLSLAKRVIMGLWVLAIVLTLPDFIFWTTVSTENGDTHCIFRFPFWGDTVVERMNVFITMAKVSLILHFIIGFSIPMSIITVCYGIIIAKIHKKRMTKSSRPLHVFTAVVASFFICWFPYELTGILMAVWLKEILFNGKYKIIIVLLYPTSSLAFFNSCLNPVLYVFMGHNFQERLIRSLPTSLERALTEVPDSTQTSNTDTNSASPPEERELQAM
ncbi:N-formyl peptide receptor 3 [Papio anubis]|uniref:Formyl peptide receptor 3 n=1 Tax=Papio anubis TaxID=9555 RepID=A0A8I5NK48_PAPAN|nr:N-formyl peptide receptor 3 [Papio anubis]XP_003916074.1 N-formyl peptide receptor 3 [Papio anubis]XP_017808150.1 N-formyl peptide receptor 3 [Papio anubis]XP_021787102.1 N-formyl peptide receptor 3 [Papio anubis]